MLQHTQQFSYREGHYENFYENEKHDHKVNGQ